MQFCKVNGWYSADKDTDSLSNKLKRMGVEWRCVIWTQPPSTRDVVWSKAVLDLFFDITWNMTERWQKPSTDLSPPSLNIGQHTLTHNNREDRRQVCKDHVYRMVIVEVQQYLTKPNHCIWPIKTHYTFVSTNDYICM